MILDGPVGCSNGTCAATVVCHTECRVSCLDLALRLLNWQNITRTVLWCRIVNATFHPQVLSSGVWTCLRPAWARSSSREIGTASSSSWRVTMSELVFPADIVVPGVVHLLGFDGISCTSDIIVLVICNNVLKCFLCASRHMIWSARKPLCASCDVVMHTRYAYLYF